MALTEREISLIKTISDEVKEVLVERDAEHAKQLQLCEQRIKKLELDVDGLISLLGEQ